MREIVNAIKQCPEQESSSFEDQCKTYYSYLGPPTNVDWDVLPSKTVRSPFQGVIEFALPTRSKNVEKQNLSKKQHQACADRAAVEGSIQLQVAAEVEKLGQKWHDGHYRYEFDLGSGPPELVKMLWVVKDANDTTRTSPVAANSNTCWITKAKSAGSVKVDHGSSQP